MGALTNGTPSARKPLREWRDAFLTALAQEGTVCAACRNAGISRTHAYRARQQDESFAVAWADVESTVTDKLESKAVELALAGEVKLLEFLLKARRPDVYREHTKVEHAGRVTQFHEVDLSRLDADEKRDMLALVEKANAPSDR